jgi:hypothetical protein
MLKHHLSFKGVRFISLFHRKIQILLVSALLYNLYQMFFLFIVLFDLCCVGGKDGVLFVAVSLNSPAILVKFQLGVLNNDNSRRYRLRSYQLNILEISHFLQPYIDYFIICVHPKKTSIIIDI